VTAGGRRLKALQDLAAEGVIPADFKVPCLEDKWTDALMTEAARLDDRRDELNESVADLAVYSEKDRAVAGCIVTIGDEGEFRLHEGVVERSAISAEDTVDDETDGFETRDDDEIPAIPRIPNRSRIPNRYCARSMASASCWSTTSRHTDCRSPAPIWQRISMSHSISRSMRCASIYSSGSATARTRSTCRRSRSYCTVH
jgi:hypothetical protein